MWYSLSVSYFKRASTKSKEVEVALFMCASLFVAPSWTI